MHDDPTTYSESAAGVTIGHARALRELERHGVTAADDVAAFHAALGAGPYDAGDVLAWLGY